MSKLEITRILSKLDGFSVLLAVVLSTAFQNFYSIVYDLSARMTDWFGGSTDYMNIYGPDSSWQDKYLSPLFGALVWLVAVELVLQVIKFASQKQKKK